jgi:hypothetical protein
MTMVGIYDNLQSEETYGPPSTADHTDADWASTIEADLERELARRTPLQAVLQQPIHDDRPVSKPLRMALSAIRDNLDRRTREWRGSAKVVEQSLRQLVAAEEARASALQELADVEADVARTGRRLTEALASFDETDETKDIDPLFAQSQAALDDLDRVANDLSIAQHWCRSAWKYYAEALEHEQQMRLQIQSADWAA